MPARASGVRLAWGAPMQTLSTEPHFLIHGLPSPDDQTEQRRQRRLHTELARWNRARLAPGDPRPLEEALAQDMAARRLEHGFVVGERARVKPWADEAPRNGEAFVRWFERLREVGPGQNDPLFPWLAGSASREAIVWFVHQEVGGEAGFEDLVALTQVKLPTLPKLEMARNYWDEMGCGHRSGMHGPMLDELAAELGVRSELHSTCWESLALANLMAALATDRRWVWHAVGALGVIELTAPGRAALVNDALKRLDLDGSARRYFALHATLDKKHSAAWNREVIAPLVSDDPTGERAQGIAEGALMRLVAGARCFARYRRELKTPS
jgi:hypothetical protein